MAKLIKLIPTFKDYIWGGTELKNKYNKDTKLETVAESWELSFHDDGLSLTQNGVSLKNVIAKRDWGTNCQKFDYFPTLIKFIDASKNLSVQVHPTDDYAIKNENSHGKSEMWYVVDATPDAGVMLGFKNDMTEEELQEAIASGNLEEKLNFFPVEKGDYFFIEAGTIHAICKGCIICEVQQSSNITYRVYDYHRKDVNGNMRELHVEKALSVTNLNKFDRVESQGVTKNNTIVQCKYFTVDYLDINSATTIDINRNSFKCITCIFGNGTIAGELIKQGESFFVPANDGELIIEGDLEVLVTYIS